MTAHATPDYLAIGHITIDLLPDGTAMLGGTALYAALTAARFGLRAAVLTRGSYDRHGDQIAEQLARFAGEIDIIAQSSTEPTVFTNVYLSGRRQQTIHSWAGPIDLNGLPPHWRSARIIHLAPVAQEIDARLAGRLNPDYFGATPQGWMRNWSGPPRGRVRLSALRLPREIAGRLDALVVSSEEHMLARAAVETIGARGLVAITRGAEPTQVIDRDRVYEVPTYQTRAVDVTGAGDVFAAALFILRHERLSTLSAVRHASATAALRVQAPGPEAVPTRAAVEAYLHELEQTPNSGSRTR